MLPDLMEALFRFNASRLNLVRARVSWKRSSKQPVENLY